MPVTILDGATAIVEASVIKGVSCYGAHDAVVRVSVNVNSSDKFQNVEFIRIPDSCDCEKECIKPCKTVDGINSVFTGTWNSDQDLEEKVFIYNDLRAGNYSAVLSTTTTANRLEKRYAEITVREAVKVDLFGKPATAPWNSNDGAVEGVVYGTAGTYRVSLYVGYVHSSLDSVSLEVDEYPTAGVSNQGIDPKFLARYTAAYAVETFVDDANGGRFAFGALKPGQYTVVVETFFGPKADDTRANQTDEKSNWVQSATATVYVGVDYIRTIFRLIGLVFSVAVLTWLFRHVYTLLVDVIENIIPDHKL